MKAPNSTEQKGKEGPDGGETFQPLRWGIMGAARVARRRIIPAMDETGSPVVAVAASSKQRAEQFAEENGVGRAYQGYDRLLEDPEVEAVYLPLSNGLHMEWALRTAEAGRHCLCEKPMVLSAADAEVLKDRFAQAGCRLQEAFMWRHHSQAAWVVDQVASGRMGELRRVNTSFSFTFDQPEENYRWRRDQGGGTLWDLGCYCVNASRLFFGTEPTSCSCRARFLSGERGIDESSVGWLDFENGRLATFSVSFRSAFCQYIELVGSEGRIWIDRPWNNVGQPTQVTVQRGEESSVHDFDPMNAYAAMLRDFTRAVRNPELDLAPAEDGYKQALAMEGLASSAGRGGKVWVY